MSLLWKCCRIIKMIWSQSLQERWRNFNQDWGDGPTNFVTSWVFWGFIDYTQVAPYLHNTHRSTLILYSIRVVLQNHTGRSKDLNLQNIHSLNIKALHNHTIHNRTYWGPILQYYWIIQDSEDFFSWKPLQHQHIHFDSSPQSIHNKWDSCIFKAGSSKLGQLKHTHTHTCIRTNITPYRLHKIWADR